MLANLMPILRKLVTFLRNSVTFPSTAVQNETISIRRSLNAFCAHLALFDVAPVLASKFALLRNCKVQAQLLTDSKSLFDFISKGTRRDTR